jgi:riboflavin biosynthesis pyrimidine reductase
VRRLLPLPMTDDVDLDQAYAVSSPAAGVHLRANMVGSADGAARVDGHSSGLSSAADKRLFTVLRGLCDVVLAGAGTVVAENYGPARPSQDRRAKRAAAGMAEIPPVAVVSGSLPFGPDARLFSEAVARPIVITTEHAPADRREALAGVADVVIAGRERVDLERALAVLSDRGLRRVLCEGGPHLLTELLAAGHVDELCLTVSPTLVGGDLHLLANPLPTPVGLRLEHLLEDDGSLFLRYSCSTSTSHR